MQQGGIEELLEDQEYYTSVRHSQNRYGVIIVVGRGLSFGRNPPLYLLTFVKESMMTVLETRSVEATKLRAQVTGEDPKIAAVHIAATLARVVHGKAAFLTKSMIPQLKGEIEAQKLLATLDKIS